MAEELDAGGVRAPHVLVVRNLKEVSLVTSGDGVLIADLEELECGKHASEVGVIDNEEVCNFPALDVDRRFCIHPVSDCKVRRLEISILP